MKWRPRAQSLRLLTMSAFLVFTVVGLMTELAPGTLSSFGVDSIAMICPLGALEILIASRIPVPLALISLLCVVIIGMVLGKVFCAWVCPIPLIRLLSSEKSGAGSRVSSVQDELPVSTEDPVSAERIETFSVALTESEPHASKFARFARPILDSRFLVLLGALVTTALYGFPVFCLVCPIGLTFATGIGLWRLIGFNEPSWLLLVFPLLLILELKVLKKWCHRLCPLGAIFSLVSSRNRLLRPHVDKSLCLRTTQGIACKKCAAACFEQIDLHHAQASRPLSECTKCRDCTDVCPSKAISFRKRRS